MIIHNYCGDNVRSLCWWHLLPQTPVFVMVVAPSTTSATPPFSSNSKFVEWKIGPPETVDTHSDSDIKASAEAFIADKVSQTWEIQ